MIRRATVAAAIPFVFLLTAGWSGVDFGRYWDDEAMFQKVRRALAPPPTLLPFAYDYPSVSFWVTLGVVAPEAARDPALRRVMPDTASLIAFTESDTARLRARRTFLAVSALAVLWTAGLVIAIGGGTLEAALAASILAVSWEVGYHARWIAPDALMMQFGALAVLAAARAATVKPRRGAWWLALAAAGVGFATGSKYSAWPLTLPLAIAAAATAPAGATWGQRTRRVALMLAASVAVYLVTTPGTVLQPTLFGSAIHYQLRHYATTGHGAYTIGPGAAHLRRMGEYLALVLLSPYTVVAAGWTALAVAGAARLWRQSRSLAAIVLSFPIFYVCYFALQRVMIVRNLLILAPFLALLAARGARASWEALQGTRSATAARVALVAAVAAALALNVVWDVSAVESIRARSRRRTVGEFDQWLRARPAGSVWIAPALERDMRAGGGVQTALTADSAESLAFASFDPTLRGVPANRRGLFAAVFGPREVNLAYYPDWIGDEHIVVFTSDSARALGIR